eukprot:CAMPEP_0118806734 /NCGR_PEP_ID=MMETSP1161-20130426/32765_1 /TAXON_ID=249345 /ORGANISM="Picochlorum oklahomensis, Strain CCMP2329" /LENGTH=132 /DNA_ID=CAMNT_0006735949 /DNA_START=100 /DNA_END=495 /DNA_ORIENTATION=+
MSVSILPVVHLRVTFNVPPVYCGGGEGLGTIGKSWSSSTIGSGRLGNGDGDGGGGDGNGGGGGGGDGRDIGSAWYTLIRLVKIYLKTSSSGVGIDSSLYSPFKRICLLFVFFLSNVTSSFDKKDLPFTIISS